MTAPSGDGAPLAGRRVLVVEDDALIALELEDLLTGHGVEVVGPVPTVAAALRVLESARLDAALLDVNLRGAMSTPVAQALRAAGTPFMLVTGYSPGRLDVALKGAPVLPKPIDPPAIVSTLRRLLDAGRG